MAFSDSSWKDCLDTVRSTGAYIILSRWSIDHGTHVIGTVSQSSSERDYTVAWTAGKDLAHFRMLIHEFLNKDPYIFPEEASLIILDIKSAFFMAKNIDDTKHTSYIYRRVHFVRNGEIYNIQEIDWC